ncbi:MAG TPA: hypothetical protein VF721_17615 [Pyrinomonadaceae bacterium]|jgi:hypothetical protein
MFDATTAIILTVFALALLVAPVIADAYFQRKAARYADEILEDNAEEFNKQIRANAVATLIRRSIWGLFFLAGIMLNLRAVWEYGLNRWIFVLLILAVSCFIFAVSGYGSELKRLKPLQ